MPLFLGLQNFYKAQMFAQHLFFCTEKPVDLSRRDGGWGSALHSPEMLQDFCSLSPFESRLNRAPGPLASVRQAATLCKHRGRQRPKAAARCPQSTHTHTQAYTQHSTHTHLHSLAATLRSCRGLRFPLRLVSKNCAKQRK